MLLGILLTFLILVCIALAGVVLLQRSEGGALGMGGGPSGFMSTRGAGDLLTRTTWILGGVLFALCLGLTILQGRLTQGGSVVDRLKIDPLSVDQQLAPIAPAAPASAPAEQSSGFEAPKPQVNAGARAGAPDGGFGAPAAPASAPTAPAKP
jgi:preprotein translocase subunit SecG